MNEQAQKQCMHCGAALHGDWLTIPKGEFCNHLCAFKFEHKNWCRGCDAHGLVGNMTETDECDFCNGTGIDPEGFANLERQFKIVEYDLDRIKIAADRQNSLIKELSCNNEDLRKDYALVCEALCNLYLATQSKGRRNRD